MEYIDQTEYERRIEILQEMTSRHPDLLRAVTDEDREALQQYFLAADGDVADYRRAALKAEPLIELRANQAYERFLAEAGLPETLPLRS